MIRSGQGIRFVWLRQEVDSLNCHRFIATATRLGIDLAVGVRLELREECVLSRGLLGSIGGEANAGHFK
jgi:hypothetical protein